MTECNSALVAVSNTTVKLISWDNNGKPQTSWYESGNQRQGSAFWLKNGKAFLTTAGGNVTAHVIDNLREKEQPPVVLSLPPGPLLGRVSGDGRCLVLAQSAAPGSLNVYDMGSLLGGTVNPAKPTVVLQDHNYPILAVAASTATNHIATSNSHGVVYYHEAGSGSRRTLGPLPGGPVATTVKRCLAFSQQSKPLRLAAGADDGQVLVWDISPVVSGPVIMPFKMRGMVMGVGFAAYSFAPGHPKLPSSVLLACSDNGNISVTDVRNFPNVQSNGSFTVDLGTALSCMAVRDDGQMAVVGTKDGHVGLFRVSDLINQRQGFVPSIVSIDTGTHLEVTDLSFQRHREPKEPSREGARTSLVMGLPSGAVPESSTTAQQAPPADAMDGRRGSGRVPEPSEGLEEEPPLKKHATHAHSVLMAAGSGAQRRGLPDKQDGQTGRGVLASITGPVAAAASQRQQPATSSAGAASAAGSAAMARPAAAARPATPSGPGAATTGSGGTAAAAAGPAGQPSGAQPSSSSGQPQAYRHPAVPPVVIPGVALPVAQHRRPSEVGGGNASSSTTPTGAQGAAEEAVGVDGNMLTSPAARAVAGAGASSSSPVSSPLRPRSPRATLSGGGYPPARPYGSSGGDLMSATGLRSYLDDMRQEMRDLVHGLQADMVRINVAAEMQHQSDIALLQQENRVLLEEVLRLRQELANNLRFGTLGQQGAPWQ